MDCYRTSRSKTSSENNSNSVSTGFDVIKFLMVIEASDFKDNLILVVLCPTFNRLTKYEPSFCFLTLEMVVLKSSPLSASIITSGLY